MYRIRSIPLHMFDAALSSHRDERFEPVTLVNILDASDDRVVASFIFDNALKRGQVASLALDAYNADVAPDRKPLTLAQFFDLFVVSFDHQKIRVVTRRAEQPKPPTKRRRSEMTRAHPHNGGAGVRTSRKNVRQHQNAKEVRDGVLSVVESEAEYGNAGVGSDIALRLKLPVAEVREALVALVESKHIVRVAPDSYELRCEDGSNS